MIVVTGATGHLGRAIVEQLLARVPAEDVAVSVRDPDAATALAERGVRVRRGDFADPSTLAHAFEDASQVLVVSVDVLGETGIARSTTAIDAAYRAGAQRVLYTSHQAAHPDSLFAPARDHAAVEAHLEARGRPFTSLRNGYYATSLEFHLGGEGAVRSGEIAAPADGAVSWTTRDDLAEGAAAILAGERRFDGPTPPLTAHDAVDLADVAAILAELSGRSVRRVLVGDEDFVARAVAEGAPESLARLLLATYHASRRGEFAATDPTLEQLLGRRPVTIGAALASGAATATRSRA